MKYFLTICNRVQTTCRSKFPAALADIPSFWEWAGATPLYLEFRMVQGRLDEALDLGHQTSQDMSLATEWGRKFLESSKGFEVACRSDSGP